MKVKFIKSSNEQVKWGNNDDPSKYLKEGNIYDVMNKEVHSWHTKIILKDFPDKKFNDVSFEYID